MREIIKHLVYLCDIFGNAGMNGLDMARHSNLTQIAFFSQRKKMLTTFLKCTYAP